MTTDNRISVQDSQAFVRSMDALSTDIIFCDPPYGLGSEVIIRLDGKPDYSKAADFMSKWDMPTGDYWEAWFREAYRTLKHGGYCVMYGMDRKLLLFKYYAALAGFSERQSLYWYFISNFPKASDLSKNLDKNAGAERKVVSIHPNPAKPGSAITRDGGDFSDKVNITAPTTNLAKKYDGYKYSVSPLKQTNETIMVFQKPYKTGSCLHDTLAYENGDKTCCCGALAIEDGRCPASNEDIQMAKVPQPKFGSETDTTYNFKAGKGRNGETFDMSSGRYPAQTFVSPEAGEVLGDVSRILHKCAYETKSHDLYFYAPKVRKQERNCGCEEIERKIGKFTMDGGEDTRGRPTPMASNNHPCCKPISLNTRILRLFKTPNPQRILIPFCGSGSEIIGAIKAGFTDWEACEINHEYVAIAEARIKHWAAKPEQQALDWLEAHGVSSSTYTKSR